MIHPPRFRDADSCEADGKSTSKSSGGLLARLKAPKATGTWPFGLYARRCRPTWALSPIEERASKTQAAGKMHGSEVDYSPVAGTDRAALETDS